MPATGSSAAPRPTNRAQAAPCSPGRSRCPAPVLCWGSCVHQASSDRSSRASFRMSPYLHTLALLALAGTVGCASQRSDPAPIPQGVVQAEQARQRELALTDVEHHQSRLDSIAYPLLAGATSLCP